MGRFVKGQSGNPNGRPKARRPHISAFNIILDKRLTASHNGVERELTVDEALQFQTYQAAIKGSKMAVRVVLKMIKKREIALAKLAPEAPSPVNMQVEHSANNTDEALRLLGITYATNEGVGRYGRDFKLASWAIKKALDRLGRGKVKPELASRIRNATHDPDSLKLPSVASNG